MDQYDPLNKDDLSVHEAAEQLAKRLAARNVTFEKFREDKILRGEHRPMYDVWDPVHPPRRVDKPVLVKYNGRVYQVIETKGDKIKIQPLHGGTPPKMVSTTSCRLKKA